jgi:hypothetical protein
MYTSFVETFHDGHRLSISSKSNQISIFSKLRSCSENFINNGSPNFLSAIHVMTCISSSLGLLWLKIFQQTYGKSCSTKLLDAIASNGLTTDLRSPDLFLFCMSCFVKVMGGCNLLSKSSASISDNCACTPSVANTFFIPETDLDGGHSPQLDKKGEARCTTICEVTNDSKFC